MEAMVALTSTSAASFEIQHVKSSRGIRAWLVETPDLPIIALHLAFRDAGSIADPAERQGLAAFGAQMLTEGAGELDASAYQERLSELGATLPSPPAEIPSWDVSRPSVTIAIRRSSYSAWR